MAERDDLRGHGAIVTGASGGIGYEFARCLASRGCSLVLIDINGEKLNECCGNLSQEYGVVAYPVAIDLTRDDSVPEIEDYLMSKHLDPDILINNAGIFSFCPVSEMADRRVETFLRLHVDAVTNLTRWFCKRRIPKGSGKILNMSSMSCWMPMPGIAMYSATKAYIRVLTRAMHYELKDSGVTLTVACPGGIATDLFGLTPKLKKFAVAIGVLDTPEKFAAKAVRSMMRGRRQYINGLLNRISIVAVGVTPTWVRMLVKRKLLDAGLRR